MNTLEQAIQQYAQAYYDGDPLISDLEFDSLVLQLRSENPDSELLKTGWGYEVRSNHLKKYPHSFHAGSLSKLHVDKIISGKDKFSDTNGLYVTAKLDGASAVVYYEDGKLVRVLSRGNGIEGLDITANIKHALPNEISEKWISAIRGEVVVTWDDCIKAGGSHPRNVATGLSQSKSKTAEELSILHFVPYYIHDFVHSKDAEINYLAQLGFEEIPFLPFISFLEFKNNLLIPSLKEVFDRTYPIDGIVLTDGTGSSIAVKFEDESTETKVNDIHWELSRTGRMVPVLEVETVNLRGANISRVTANNATWIKEQGCGIDSVIEIVRANEVIPKVVGVLERTDIQLPERCPECDSKLESYNRDLVCVNENCICRTGQIIFNIFNSVGIDGIGPAIIEKVMFEYELDDITSLTRFINIVHPEELIDLLGPAKGKLFIHLIDKLLLDPVDIKTLILNCNIPNVGESATNAIVKEFNSFNKFSSLIDTYRQTSLLFEFENMVDLINFPNYLARENFIKCFDRIQLLFGFYPAVLFKEELKDSTKKKINITLTGTLSKSRKEILKDFNEYAVVTETSISAANFLVTNEVDGSSAKFKAAKKNGIQIITEENFFAFLKNNCLQTEHLVV